TTRRPQRRAALGGERAREREHLRLHPHVGAAMTGGRILLVEDNEKNMKLVRDVLRAAGYNTLEAWTGRQALELALGETPDLVVMDVRLPDIDGLAALSRLRADERTAA